MIFILPSIANEIAKKVDKQNSILFPKEKRIFQFLFWKIFPFSPFIITNYRIEWKNLTKHEFPSTKMKTYDSQQFNIFHAVFFFVMGGFVCNSHAKKGKRREIEKNVNSDTINFIGNCGGHDEWKQVEKKSPQESHSNRNEIIAREWIQKNLFEYLEIKKLGKIEYETCKTTDGMGLGVFAIFGSNCSSSWNFENWHRNEQKKTSSENFKSQKTAIDRK